MSPLSREVLEQAAYDLRGTCETLEAYIERLDLPIDSETLEDELLNVSTEICGGCGWWHEVSDLEFDEARNCGLCDQCREEDE